MIISRTCSKCQIKIIIYGLKNTACPICYPNYSKSRKFYKKTCLVCKHPFCTNKSDKKNCSFNCQKNSSTTKCFLGKLYYFKLRNNFECKRCKKIVNPSGSKDRLHVHHKVPKKYGGLDIESNYICLCAGCHVSVHNHPDRNKDFIEVPLDYTNHPKRSNR